MNPIRTARVAVITPTRRDRQEFFELAELMLERQTFDDYVWIVVDYPPKSDKNDITERYFAGIKEARELGCKLAVFWEDDDYYPEYYLENMYKLWVDHGECDLIGHTTTIYYHLKSRKFRTLIHRGRASMFATAMSLSARPKAEHDPNRDDIAFLDLRLWEDTSLSRCTFTGYMAIGIKHGIGKSGGSGHRAESVGIKDKDFRFLKSKTDHEVFERYAEINKKLNNGK